jgi:hypothetical protein
MGMFCNMDKMVSEKYEEGLAMLKAPQRDKRRSLS